MKKSERLSRVFRPFTKIPGVRLLLGPIYHYLLLDRVKNKEIKIFQANAITVLAEFDRIMSQSHINYFLMWGSMLGAVREKGFIKHDFDIDVGIWRSDYNELLHHALIENGFKRLQRFSIDNTQSAMEETYEKNGVTIDIFYIFEDNNGTYTCVFDTIGGLASFDASIKKYGNVDIFRYYLKISREVKYVPFEDKALPIPISADEILKETYGESYMFPDKKWSRDPNIRERARWHGKKVEFIRYEN